MPKVSAHVVAPEAPLIGLQIVVCVRVDFTTRVSLMSLTLCTCLMDTSPTECLQSHSICSISKYSHIPEAWEMNKGSP